MATEAESWSKEEVAAALGRFHFERLLNQDQAGRRVSLAGAIDDEPAVVIVERAAFPDDPDSLRHVVESALQDVETIGVNDIYSWHMGHASGAPRRHDVKINLIWPATAKHMAKYSAQGVRSVTETPRIYRERVRPLMQRDRDAGRLQWIYDILEGRAEQEDVMHRRVGGDHSDSPDEGFMLLPDLNWDRRTLASLHCLAICERRDLWSLRDLAKRHVPWLKRMRERLLAATTQLYPQLEADQLKLYVHYQPTYYHFHVHVVNVLLDPGSTQAVGKAIGLDGIIDQLERMAHDDDGMEDATLVYSVGEASELWLEVYEPLKRQQSKQGTTS